MSHDGTSRLAVSRQRPAEGSGRGQQGPPSWCGTGRGMSCVSERDLYCEAQQPIIRNIEWRESYHGSKNQCSTDAPVCGRLCAHCGASREWRTGGRHPSTSREWRLGVLGSWIQRSLRTGTAIRDRVYHQLWGVDPVRVLGRQSVPGRLVPLVQDLRPESMDVGGQRVLAAFTSALLIWASADYPEDDPG